MVLHYIMLYYILPAPGGHEAQPQHGDEAHLPHDLQEEDHDDLAELVFHCRFLFLLYSYYHLSDTCLILV